MANEKIGDPAVYACLEHLGIKYGYTEHPPAPTIEIARKYWKGCARHCKNLFFRNHKGNRHYLAVFDGEKDLDIRRLELLLKQGKLSFASERRMWKYLRVQPGSVSPFCLLNDEENHVHMFLDKNLSTASYLAFHPNDNRATVEISGEDFLKVLEVLGNTYEWTELY